MNQGYGALVMSRETAFVRRTMGSVIRPQDQDTLSQGRETEVERGGGGGCI